MTKTKNKKLHKNSHQLDKTKKKLFNILVFFSSSRIKIKSHKKRIAMFLNRIEAEE